MRKLFKVLGIIFALLFIFFAGSYFYLNESLPEGTSGPAADEMATKMMESLNYEAWQNTEMVSWTFRGEHHYEWNKAEDLVTVKWDEHEVILNTKTESGVVANGQNYGLSQVNELVRTAKDYFNNDSFWLCAPFKVFDPGTERSIVTLSDGREGLKVTYTSGGSTPGDSYVWLLDENNRPEAVKMWVQIIPIGGLKFSWENYITLPSGAMVAKDHIGLGGVNVVLEDVQ